MYCETCPVRDYCKAYKGALENNSLSYHRQDVVRVEDWWEPPCPLLELIQSKAGGKKFNNALEADALNWDKRELRR